MGIFDKITGIFKPLVQSVTATPVLISEKAVKPSRSSNTTVLGSSVLDDSLTAPQVQINTIVEIEGFLKSFSFTYGVNGGGDVTTVTGFADLAFLIRNSAKIFFEKGKAMRSGPKDQNEEAKGRKALLRLLIVLTQVIAFPLVNILEIQKENSEGFKSNEEARKELQDACDGASTLLRLSPLESSFDRFTKETGIVTSGDFIGKLCTQSPNALILGEFVMIFPLDIEFSIEFLQRIVDILYTTTDQLLFLEMIRRMLSPTSTETSGFSVGITEFPADLQASAVGASLAIKAAYSSREVKTSAANLIVSNDLTILAAEKDKVKALRSKEINLEIDLEAEVFGSASIGYQLGRKLTEVNASIRSQRTIKSEMMSIETGSATSSGKKASVSKQRNGSKTLNALRDNYWNDTLKPIWVVVSKLSVVDLLVSFAAIDASVTLWDPKLNVAVINLRKKVVSYDPLLLPVDPSTGLPVSLLASDELAMRELLFLSRNDLFKGFKSASPTPRSAAN